MGKAALPLIDGPIEAWCEFCSNRDLPPEIAYCSECRPTLRRYREARDRRPARRFVRLLGALVGRPSPGIPVAAPRATKD